MSQHSAGRPPAASTTVVVAAVVVMFCFTIAAVVAIAVAVPEGANPGSLIVVVLSAFSSVVPALLALVKITGVAGQVDQLSNGLMDAKIRAGLADVLAPDLIHDDAVPQLEADRRRRNGESVA